LLASFAILLCSSALGLAQDIATKGGISGRVTDSAGAAIANAKVTITGQAGDRTVTANAEGEFEMQNLIPGAYKVKVEQALRIKPDYAEVYLLAGNLFLKTRNAANALQMFEEYLRLEPKGNYAAQTREMVEKIRKAMPEKKQ